MLSFRRLALLLALGLPAVQVLQAQSSSQSPGSSSPEQQTQDSAQQPAAQQPAAPQPSAQNQSQPSVQSRIRARREARRAAAIREVYSHLYEAYVGAGYLRFAMASPLQRVNEYNWNVGFTRYYSERLGVTLDGRGYYGTPFVYNNLSAITKPAISEYAALGGPTYRFYLKPRYSIAGRVMGGVVIGNFSGDANGAPTSLTHLYPDGATYGIAADIIGEYNVSPDLGLRLAPGYVGTGFGSSMQNNFGFTAGLVYRFGKQ